MATTYRDYSLPNYSVTRTSTEINPCGRLRAQPFTQSEITRIKLGYYSGSNSPKWRARMRKGELLPKAAYTRFDQLSTASGWRHLYWIKVLHDYHWCYHESINAIAWVLEGSLSDGSFEPRCWAEIEKLQSDAEGLLQEAAADVSDSWDALTFAAELAQVRSMFLHLGENIISHLAKKPLKTAANAWLEWQFGWRQLWNDAQSIIKVAARLGRPASRCRKTKKTTRSYVSETVVDLERTNGDKNRYYITDTVEVKCNAQVIAQISNDLGRIQVNPVATAWELIPFSFVIDYFFNIGAWIGAASLVSFGTPYKASVGYDVVWNRRVVLKPNGINANKGILDHYDCGGEASVSAHLRHRSPRTVNLRKLPRLNLDPLSITRIINLVSLAVQRSK